MKTLAEHAPEETPEPAGLQAYLAPTLLANSDHPRVVALAARLSEEAPTPAEKADRLALFVRDVIAYGLPPSGDETSASRTLSLGYGHETAKATLLAALARAVGIPARLHFARFEKTLYKEFLPGWLYALMPAEVCVAWAELHVGGHWQARPDAGQDPELLTGGNQLVRQHGRLFGTGLTVDPLRGRSAWTAQLLARLPLVSDEGSYRDTMDYLWSKDYPTPRRHPAVAWLLGPLGREEYARRVEQTRLAASFHQSLPLAA